VRLFLVLLHGVMFQTGWMQPQRFMERLCFLSVSLEPMSCHSSTWPRVAHQTSPIQMQIGKRGINTIFDHFRDKPARFPHAGVQTLIGRRSALFYSEGRVLHSLSVRFVSARDIAAFAVLFVYILSVVSVFPRPGAAYYDFSTSIYDKNLK
jgi:hypothetical protein